MPSPARVFTPDISQGEQVSAEKLNALDRGQFNALVRNGSAALLAASEFVLGAFDLLVTGGGAGKFRPSAADTIFSGAGWPGLDARSVAGAVVPAAPVFTSGEFEVGAGFLRQLSASKVLVFYVVPPVDSVITAIKVPLSKSASGTFPTTKAAIALSYIDLATGAATQIGATTTDPAADLTAYKAHHVVSLAGLAHTVALGRAYQISVIGDDNSADSSTGLRVYRPMLDLTISKLRTP